jgi:hypothetical protein
MPEISQQTDRLVLTMISLMLTNKYFSIQLNKPSYI